MAKISTVFVLFQELGCSTLLSTKQYAMRGKRPQLMRKVRKIAAAEGCKVFQAWGADITPNTLWTKWI